MRRGFFNGLLTGGLIGAALIMMVTPQFKKERVNLMKDTKDTRKKARGVVRSVKSLANDWMK